MSNDPNAQQPDEALAASGEPTAMSEAGPPSGVHDYSAEPDGLRDVHENVHSTLADIDPTDNKGKPLLIAGFLIVMLAVLLVFLFIGMSMD